MLLWELNDLNITTSCFPLWSLVERERGEERKTDGDINLLESKTVQKCEIIRNKWTWLIDVQNLEVWVAVRLASASDRDTLVVEMSMDASLIFTVILLWCSVKFKCVREPKTVTMSVQRFQRKKFCMFTAIWKLGTFFNVNKVKIYMFLIKAWKCMCAF